MAQEPTTVKRTVTGKVSNPTKIAFPLDDTGFTSMLRKEGVRAAGRLHLSQAKLDVYLSTLRCLAQHAQAKLDAAQADWQATLTAQEVARQEAVLRAARDQANEVERLEALVVSTQAEIELKKTS